MLRHDADADARLPRGLRHRLADHLDRAAIGFDEPEAAAQRGRLARAVRPEQAEALAAADLERQAADDLVVAVALAQAGDAQDDVARRSATAPATPDGGCAASGTGSPRGCHIPVIVRCRCGSRPWKKWPQPGNTTTGNSCGRAHAKTSGKRHDVVLLAVDDDGVGGNGVDGETPARPGPTSTRRCGRHRLRDAASARTRRTRSRRARPAARAPSRRSAPARSGAPPAHPRFRRRRRRTCLPIGRRRGN